MNSNMEGERSNIHHAVLPLRRLPESLELRLQGHWISAEVDATSLRIHGVDSEPTIAIPVSHLIGLQIRWLDPLHKDSRP